MTADYWSTKMDPETEDRVSPLRPSSLQSSTKRLEKPVSRVLVKDLKELVGPRSNIDSRGAFLMVQYHLDKYGVTAMKRSPYSLRSTGRTSK